MPPISAIGITLAASSVSMSEAKLMNSSMQISARLQRHDDREAAERLLQFAELADPFQAVAAGQSDLVGDLLLRLEHRAAEIAAAHAELDRDVALLVLAIDEGRAGDQLDLRPRRSAGSARRRCRSGSVRADGDAADGVEALAVFRREAHDDREIAVAARPHRGCRPPGRRSPPRSSR